MSYSIRKLAASELELLLPLMKDCFGMDVDLSYLQWKYLDNPAGSFVGFAAFHDETGECAGYYGVIPERYLIDGNAAIIHQSGDTMTHSRHRRQGLFFKMATVCYQYLESCGDLFVIGFTGEQSTPGFEKLGWQHLFPIRYVGIPLTFCRLYRILHFVSAKKYEYEPKSTYDLATQLAARRKETFQQSYDHEFLRWRLANPRLKYQYEEFSYQGELVGYWCYCIINQKIFVTDADITELKYASAIRSRIATLVEQQGLLGSLSFTQERTHFSRVLTRAGFLRNPFSRGPLSQSSPFMIRASGQNEAALSAPERWAVRPIYHDAF